MSLFEIELNSDFKIHNSNIFFDEKKLKKYYKLNKLNDNYDDDIKEMIEEHKLYAHQDLFVINNYKYEFDEINNIILSNIYKSNANSKEHILYPEWLLFFISIKKEKVRFIKEKEFYKYLEYFTYIAEIRYKKYIIRNVRNYIDFKEWGKVSDIENSLHDSLLEYLKESEYETEELYDYLNFLYKFHQELKDNEKYKLMWNIEVYIKETITLLLDKEIPLKEIYEEVYKYMRGTYSVLHEIYIYKPLYIEESKNQFKSYLEIINKIFNSNIDLEKFISILTKNEKYEDILFSCIDLNKRFNANKLNEHLMGTIARSMVLNLEEVIKDYKEERKLLKCLKSLSEDKILFESYIIEGYNSSDELLELLDKLICDNEQSLEQYLAIYLASRNYLAHYNIDMDKFFWGLDGKRRIISNTLNSVIVILYRIEILKEK
ncbi:hypothetical protein L5F09_05605 [Aliarcobacter butzleri]|uniref:hypothetical protein n=1 Tax=Aliarcobacter butzleri TaxID=28197 RepID=UPI001EDB12F2|nr:hypothetical protein [Aliarcobacter butzleri]MCG3665218.1 hypothetical protein [Aliarcobacter butzleri]